MEWAMAAILIALWAFGLASGAALGLWVHQLLGLAMVSIAFAIVGALRKGRPTGQPPHGPV
jgi:hypothetical protein